MTGTTLAVALIVALHAIQPGLDPLGRTISEYGAEGSWWWFFFGVALGALALTAAIVTGDRPTPGPAGLLGMAAFGLATIVTALFPTDPVDPAAGELRLSRTGVIHATAGMFAFTSLSIAAPCSPAGWPRRHRHWPARCGSSRLLSPSAMWCSWPPLCSVA